MEENSTTAEESSKAEEKIEFKKPVLFGRVGKLPKKVSNDPAKPPEETVDEKQKISSDAGTESKQKSFLPPAVSLKELCTPIPYKEPKWSGLCPDDGSDYALEVLKSGMIMENIDLCTKPFYLFGRLANCNVIMAHPTISRYHAVLQYKAFAEEGGPPSGWYLQDLGSTHGTFLNKERLKASHYSRVRVGHQIRFGSSTRTYILLGPDFDSEGESELTVTEIKKKAEQMKQERDRIIQEAIEQRERDRLLEEKKREKQGIDWGMGEDAEEEPDLADNPYASTANEELYLTDPKKTLRGYFEREGLELNYDCEERGQGQFVCRVELPMDDARGRPVKAEVIHKGKKKEAVIACALEACRMLDRAGLLRQARHESRRRKQRDWGADDYYDSDEDTFLDRTGSVESKRRRRMEQLGAPVEEDRPLTYDDLLKRVSDIETKIQAEERALESLRASSKPAEAERSETDALDEYMDSLGRQGQSMAQKAQISKTKMSIQRLRSELAKTRRLAELARPAHLPPLLKRGEGAPVKMANSVVYGRRIRLKEDAEKRPKPRKEVKQEDSEFVEEIDSDEETEREVAQQISESQRTPQKETESPSSPQKERELQSRKSRHPESVDQRTPESSTEKSEGASEKEDGESSSTEEDAKSKRVFGPMRPPENYVIPESYFDQPSDRDVAEIMED